MPPIQRFWAICGLALPLALPVSGARAQAPASRAYVGSHPVPARAGGGYCSIEGIHMHTYVPDRPVLFQIVGDAYLFVGDPVPFGYRGPRTVFYGIHPVHVPLPVPPPAPIFCALPGPHYHPYAPPAGPDYVLEGGVAFYVGSPPPAPVVQRSHAFEAEYRPFAALRPQVVVKPPKGWRGTWWVAPPAAPTAKPPPVQVVAPSPRVVVAPPAP
ncbi:MAG: hypothetical protein RMK29_05435, partial [Myxococcales bacterium]|nr:hypothetical protein [Myxococcales bacterium]